MTGTVEIPQAVNYFYDRTMLERGLPELLYGLFAQIKDIPQGSGTSIKFRKYGAFAEATTPLVQSVTPTGKDLSITDIMATVAWYGDYTLFSDQVSITTFDPLLTELAQVLGEQAGQTLDTLMRDVLVAGTNVRYADASSPKVNAARTDVVAADKLDGLEVRLGARTLKQGRAKRITRMVNADTGYATSPVDACFVGIIHENTTFDLQNDPLWVPIEKYAGSLGGGKLPAEVGKIDIVRFLETDHAKVFTAGGGGGIDVYATIILGMNAYGMTRISGEAMRNIVKPLGSAGSADPLDQRQTSGWKATWAGLILQQLFMVRIEHAVSV